MGPTVPVYDSTPKYQEYRRLGEHVFVEREGRLRMRTPARTGHGC